MGTYGRWRWRDVYRTRGLMCGVNNHDFGTPRISILDVPGVALSSLGCSAGPVGIATG